MSQNNNPFSELIGSKNNESSSGSSESISVQKQLTSKKSNENQCVQTINNIVENVFHFTINADAADEKSGKQLVYLEELAQVMNLSCIDLQTLEQALFERLLLGDIEKNVIPKSSKVFKEHVVQKLVFPYLFNSMQNLQSYENINDDIVRNGIKKMKELIFRNAVTVLKQPALFEDQDFANQLLELLQHVDPQSHIFFIDLVEAFMAEGHAESKDQLRDIMIPVLKKMYIELKTFNIIDLPIYILPSINLFASSPFLAPILLEACEPEDETIGINYQNTIIGGLLALSPLPRTAAGPQVFFDNPLDQTSISMTETSLWNATSHLINNMHKVFLTLLKAGPDIKYRLLRWIAKCLKNNAARGKLWNIQGGEYNSFTLNYVSDGFMLNLGAVLLQLCQPFCSVPNDPKSLKIDPTYGAVPPEECEAKLVHLDCLHRETCLLPVRETEEGVTVKRPTAETYNFVTECFFMTQKCIDLGFRVCVEKLYRCSQEVNRAQRQVEVAGSASNLVERLLQFHMAKYLCLRCALLEKDTLTNLHRFQAMTCTWLVQVSIRENETRACYAPGGLLPVELPVTTPPPDTLRCIPEFVLENVIVVLTLTRRMVSAINEEADLVGLLPPALTLILAFMRDSSRTYNPHLRARLAECLEAMLPNHGTDPQPMSSMASFYREQLFKEHPHRLQLVPCLLDVFVGIEMTGQSVQFEQKFNYRRPMYVVMEFLWGIQEHRDAFTHLANEAEANMEAVHPPIFLRFVNLLINDAIFLLDEALSNMAQIRIMQNARGSGAWASLPAHERDQNQANLTHIGMLARFDNILGKDTVRTLARLTAHAPHVFCHPTLVDRVASMLNYFLLHLVGPTKKNFKVKDMKEYQFDPAVIVLDICRMYVELGSNERFCAAVSDDGRSYSPQLFTLAEMVLARIGGGGLISSLQEVASRINTMAVQRKRDEDILANAPDEFLDPIMSTLMLDPVVLPSSRTIVDRTTIARHLLSDQSDPFNRSPLSMDQVKSDTDLKQRIHAWIAEQRQKVQLPESNASTSS